MNESWSLIGVERVEPSKNEPSESGEHVQRYLSSFIAKPYQAFHQVGVHDFPNDFSKYGCHSPGTGMHSCGLDCCFTFLKVYSVTLCELQLPFHKKLKYTLGRGGEPFSDLICTSNHCSKLPHMLIIHASSRNHIEGRECLDVGGQRLKSGPMCKNMSSSLFALQDPSSHVTMVPVIQALLTVYLCVLRRYGVT